MEAEMTTPNIITEFKPDMEIKDKANGAVSKVITVEKRTGRFGKCFTIVTAQPTEGNYKPFEFIADGCTSFEHVAPGHLQVIK